MRNAEEPGVFADAYELPFLSVSGTAAPRESTLGKDTVTSVLHRRVIASCPCPHTQTHTHTRGLKFNPPSVQSFNENSRTHGPKKTATVNHMKLKPKDRSDTTENRRY